MNTINEPYTLIQSIVDTSVDLLVIIENEKPVLMNRACCEFFGVNSFEEYSNGFGDFVNNFVPHPSYFNSNKVEAGQSWIEALDRLDEKEKIVSLVNTSHEPRAFSVSVDSSHPSYTVLSFTDISANLIKRIMIDNDANLDKESGAYNKEYFLRTAEILQDGAAFNEKEIGLTMINVCDPKENTLPLLVGAIKNCIRENDMVIKYSPNKLLLAYLVDSKDNALLFSEKLKKKSSGMDLNISLTLVKQREKLTASIKRLNIALEEKPVNKLQLI